MPLLEYQSLITKEMATSHRLMVTLYRGYYFDRFKGKDVNVLVQMDGCSLNADPVPEAPADAPKKKPAKQTAANAVKAKPRSQANRNLLSFPATVDENGVLEFVESNHASLGNLFMRSNKVTYSMIRRVTPAQCPIMVLPGVQHVYLYIVTVGEDDLPPAVFGRLRVGTDGPNEQPRWKRMRYDASVQALPPSHFRDSNAGFVLGSATLVDPETYESNATGPVANSHSLFPRATQPKSVMCRPFVGESVVYVGSPGENVESTNKGDTKMRTAYCHLDVLTARSLPCMDPDGLCDPCFTVRLADKTVDFTTEVPKSMNPTFMLRTVIPINVEAGDGPGSPPTSEALPHDSFIPLPPILLTMWDRDIVGEGYGRFSQVIEQAAELTHQGMMFNQIGGVAIKHSPVLDGDRLEGKGLNVNSLHTPLWYALDASAYTDFNSREPGGIEASWKDRARVLVAAGFSAQADIVKVGEDTEATLEEPTFRQMVTQEVAYYKMHVDLLGVRNIRNQMMAPLQLEITSFWQPDSNGADKISLEFGDNPNFQTEEIGPNYQEFVDLVKPIIRISEHDPVQQKFQNPGIGLQQDSDGLAPVVEMDNIIGTRIVPPVYQAYLPEYLQSDEYKTGDSKEPFVLMPELVFQVKNTVSGTDVGATTVSLPLLSPTQGVNEKSWLSLSLSEFKELPDSKKRVPLISATVEEDSYLTFIDVFAAQTGWLTWDEDLRMGRPLSTQRLFSISRKNPEDAEEEAEERRRAGITEEEEDETEINQFFNIADWMLDDHRFNTLPFNDSVRPFFHCANWDKDANKWLSTRESDIGTKPLGPQTLFPVNSLLTMIAPGDIAHRKGKDRPMPTQDSLKSMSTKDIRQTFKDYGFRAMSHIVAPQKVCKQHDPTYHGCAKLLKSNQHTFMRPLGHTISFTDRDSRFLARLRIGLPESLFEANADPSKKQRLEQLQQMQSESNSYLNIKFLKEGTIVWAAPLHRDAFVVAGECLFVVEVEGSKRVQVLVPSTDLRFQLETAWFPVKTVTMRWRNLQNRINAQAKKDQLKKKKQPKGAMVIQDEKAQPENNGMDEEEGGGNVEAEKANDEERDDSDDDAKKPARKHEVEGDGYGRPIYVHENSFVLRLKQRRGGHMFDRSQTNAWYYAVLRHAFPEVEEYRDTMGMNIDGEAIERMFFSRFLNIRRALVSGEAQNDAGMIKGHVTIKKVEVNEGFDKLAKAEAPFRPIQNLWVKSRINICCTLLTFQLTKTDGDDKPSPYFVAEVIGTGKSFKSDVIEDQPSGQAFIPFYKAFTLWAETPGLSVLEIRFYDQSSVLGVTGDTLLGKARVDIEDRWMTLQRNILRSRSQPVFIDTHMSPPEPIKVARPKKKDVPRVSGNTRACWDEPISVELAKPEDQNVVDIPSRLAPQLCLPTEYLDVMLEDEDTGMDTKVGTMRMILDMSRDDEMFHQPEIDTQSLAMEIRVTIWGVKGISIFKDVGERNDVIVKGKLRVKDIYGRETFHNRQTDSHKWAHSDANFNWLWIFNVTAPVMLVSLTLSLMDEDTFTSDDYIYNPVQYPLDHLLMLVYKNFKDGRESITHPAREKVVFDQWPKRHKEDDDSSDEDHQPQRRSCLRRCCYYVCCCVCCRRRPWLTPCRPATLTMDVFALPAAEAQQLPAKEEGCLSPPKDRLTYMSGVSNPWKFAVTLVGRKNCKTLAKISCCLVCIITILAMLACSFFLLQSLTSVDNLIR